MTHSVDPRTLKRIETAADCHLIPERFQISSRTVRLDREVDNLVGTKCDRQLYELVEFRSGNFNGKAAIRGGSNSVTASFSHKDRQFKVFKSPRVSADSFARKALQLDKGRLPLESFTGRTIDLLGANLSVVHSAFLVLYSLGIEEVFGSSFDWFRLLLEKLGRDESTTADHELVRRIVEFHFVSAAEFDRLRRQRLDGWVSHPPHGWTVVIPYKQQAVARVAFSRDGY